MTRQCIKVANEKRKNELFLGFKTIIKLKSWRENLKANTPKEHKRDKRRILRPNVILTR